MELDFELVHILKARCFILYGDAIQLLLYRNKEGDIYSFTKLIDGKVFELCRSGSLEIPLQHYNDSVKFYRKGEK